MQSNSPSVAYIFVDYVDAMLASEYPENRSMALGPDRFVIGRDPSCHMALPHRAVSRRHAEVINSEGRFYVVDLSSMNGTLLNGREIEPGKHYPLSNNDYIQIADVLVLKFEDPLVTAVISSRRPFLSQAIWVDELTEQVFVQRRLIDPPLTDLEFRLLRLLYSRSGRIVPREEIEEIVWPQDIGEITDDMIYNTVRRLRDRLKEHDSQNTYIENVRGIGYRFIK